MRKLLRSMAKATMRRAGVTKINKRMSQGRWRRIIGAYPVSIKTSKRMRKDRLWHGPKRQKKGSLSALFIY